MTTLYSLTEDNYTTRPLWGDNEIRLSEIISAFSMALDITEGQPVGHAIRTCLIGMRMAEALDLPAEDRSALFYALLLKDLGCSSNAAKMCWLFAADDRGVKRDLKFIDWTKMSESLKFSLSHVAPGASPMQKAMQMFAMAREGAEGARKLVETRCERGADITRMLQLPEATALAIRNLDEHWNGQGHPDRLRGEEIPYLARIACLAQTVEVFFTTQGLATAIEVAQSRRGTWFDPALVDTLVLLRDDHAFWSGVAGENPRMELQRWEPEDKVQMADEACVDRVCEAFAQVVDAKSPWTHKHSQGVAEIAVGIAKVLGHSEQTQRDIRRAGLLHDIGKLGVSNLILDKPGRPTDEEFQQIRMHPDYTEKILRQVPSFKQIADVAAAHHERLDGKGYHRRLEELQIPWQGNLLAVADIFEALTAKRPYRAELPLEKVLAIMQKDLGSAIRPEYYEALVTWRDQSNPVSRAEAQMERIEQMLTEL